VISEAAPIDTILHASEFGPATPENAAEWLRSIINAFAQPRFSCEKRLLMKFTATDVLCLPLIARVFPDVRWLFL
jgi:hypothetical protein